MTDPSWSWNEDSYHGANQQWQRPNGPCNMPTASPLSSAAGNYYSQQAPKSSLHSGLQPGNYNAQPNSNRSFGTEFQNPFNFDGTPMYSQQFISEPVLNAARQIGGQFAEQQKEKLTKYLSAFQLKYYFAVDNMYVAKKLGVILFPFLHRNWAVQYDTSDSPAPARLDVNAPDLYIPLMAYVTYVLISGFVLGTQKRFTPEQLGIITTNALVYLIFENLVVTITRYVMNISQSLTFWHSLAYSSYKFVGMNVSLLAFVIGGKSIYYYVLAYTSFAIVFFLLRTVKTFILDVQSLYSEDGGRKRKIYLLLFISFTQPFLMWWLTSSVTSYRPYKMDFAQLALSGMGLSEAVSKGQVPHLPNGEVDYEALLKMP